MESILTSVKQLLGIGESEDHFDTDIIIHINSTFATLNDLGVGPEQTFSIIDEKAMWNDFIDDEDASFNDVKTYMYLKVKMIFDPPSSSSVMDAFKRQADEIEWRLTVRASDKVMKEGNDE